MAAVSENLTIQLEWEDPAAARGEELRATWCRLGIWIGDSCVTRVADERAQTIRAMPFIVPPTPLAEWLAFNWWPLLNEIERPINHGFSERHNLRFAREGFALPDLEFVSEGVVCIRAVWKPFTGQKTLPFNSWNWASRPCEKGTLLPPKSVTSSTSSAHALNLKASRTLR